MRQRVARDVLEDHLRLARDGLVEEDLARKDARDAVALYTSGVYRGHDGIRQLAAQLAGELPDPSFDYVTVLVEREFAFLEWTASSRTAIVRDGADSFVIRDGLIVAQTIHYTLEPL